MNIKKKVDNIKEKGQCIFVFYIKYKAQNEFKKGRINVYVCLKNAIIVVIYDQFNTIIPEHAYIMLG